MPKAALLFVLALLATAAARAADTDGSNIALSEYPGPQCTKPQTPVQPQLPRDQNEKTASAASALKAQNEASSAAAYNLKVQDYNKAVAAYNSAVKDFNSCMQTYIDNGNADMARIKQRLDKAVTAANAR